MGSEYRLEYPSGQAAPFRSSLFNPLGSDLKEDRKIWYGNPTGLMQLNNVGYTWANGLYLQMREQFWIPHKIDITGDINDYQNLTPIERKAYDGILSYLTYLDSIQAKNLTYVVQPITAPEVANCLGEQNSQERMHGQSYQYIIETIIEERRRNSIYDFWRTDAILLDRCTYIASLYQRYVDTQKPEDYFITLVADYLLEGLYFYNGFVYYYNLASRQMMGGTSDIVKMINRDELAHVRLFQKLVVEGLQVFPHSKEQIYGLFANAVEHEILWTNHIMQGEVLGITEESTERYTKYLCNLRLSAIGLDKLYLEERYQKSPYVHLESFADTSKEGTTKGNYFEAVVTGYLGYSAINGWDEI